MEYALGQMTIGLLLVVWVICGLAALAASLVRRRIRGAPWWKLPALAIAASILGPIALVAVLSDHESEI